MVMWNYFLETSKNPKDFEVLIAKLWFCGVILMFFLRPIFTALGWLFTTIYYIIVVRIYIWLVTPLIRFIFGRFLKNMF